MSLMDKIDALHFECLSGLVACGTFRGESVGGVQSVGEVRGWGTVCSIITPVIWPRHG